MWYHREGGGCGVGIRKAIIHYHNSSPPVTCRAASEGRFEVIQVLSAYGVDFTQEASTGENAMHFATIGYRLLCIRLLAQRGAFLNTTL